MDHLCPPHPHVQPMWSPPMRPPPHVDHPCASLPPMCCKYLDGLLKVGNEVVFVQSPLPQCEHALIQGLGGGGGKPESEGLAKRGGRGSHAVL